MKLSVLIRSLNLMGQRKYAYFCFLGASLVATIMSTAVGPIMNKRVINAIEFAKPSLLYSSLLLLFITTVLFWIVSPIACYGAAWASKKAMFHLRSRLTGHLLKLPVSLRYTLERRNALACLE